MKKIAAMFLVMSLSVPFQAFAVGAIAVDDQAGDTDAGYGIAVGEDSESAAKAAAVKHCKEAGNDNCKPVVWFKSCGAYASSKKYYGWGYGPTKEAASSMAQEKCGGGCKIIVADCE